MKGSASALRSPDFVRVWIGLGLSTLGSQVSMVAVAWQLYQLTHSALSLGLVGLFRCLPIFATALIGGAIADTRDRRSVMLVTQSILVINVTVMALLTWTGHASPISIYAFAFVAGLVYAFDSPARQALFTNLVPSEDLPNALSLNMTIFQVATVAGPGLGGLILSVWGPGWAYLLDALSFLAMIVALATLHYRVVERAESKPLSLSAFAEGFHFLRQTPAIYWLMVLDFIATFFAGSMMLLPVFADQLLHVGPRGLGFLYAAPAVGAVAASIVLTSRSPVYRQGKTVLGAVGVYGLSIAAFGLSRNFILSLVLLAISGAADAVSTVIRQTVRQLLTPDQLRGRMTGVNMIFFVGGPQLGETEGGVVANLVSASFSVVSGGLACIVAALGLGLLVPTLRNLVKEPQDAPLPAPGPLAGLEGEPPVVAPREEVSSGAA